MKTMLHIDKPSGISCHRPTQDGFGLLEVLSDRDVCDLLPIHRLDKETSGIVLFVSRAQEAGDLAGLFASREVKKTYQFLSHGETPLGLQDKTTGQWVHSSLISRHGPHWRSTSDSPSPNATTTFTYLHPVGHLHLWQAQPITGKTHQIRLHAADLGIPILGDTRYGGLDFPAICLHALAIEIDGQRYESIPPPWFREPHIMSHPLSAALELGLDRRRRVFQFTQHSSCRTLHRESAWLTADKLGDLMWYAWYRETAPTAAELEMLKRHADQAECHGWYMVVMSNRGRDAQEHSRKLLSSSPDLPRSWIVKDDGRLFECRSQHGWSAGLFLDQRLNRSWVERVAAGKRVLNLFSYSGGFTVAALRGGAGQVVAVDTSQMAHQWSRSNVELNELDDKAVSYWTGDSREYCAKAIRKGELFDLIILDPPTFARGKKRPFSLPKEWIALVEETLALLTPGGQLLFCTNYEKLSLPEILRSLKDRLASTQGTHWILEHRFPDLDFLVGENQGEVALKSVLVSRKRGL